jgi:hypothetical protein
VNLQRSLFIAAIGAAASFSVAPKISLAAQQVGAPSAASSAKGGVQSRGVTGQSAANPGADNDANHAQGTPQNNVNQPAPTNGNNANNGNAAANNNNQTARNSDRHHRHLSQGFTYVNLYGYVPYNGLYNEGYGYDNGWYDYPGPYISDDNSVNTNGYTSSNENGYGTQAPSQSAGAATPTSQPAMSADAMAARTQMIESQSRLLKEYEAKPEYQAALKDLKQATDQFNAAVTKAQASLQENPQYQQANAQKQHADQQVEAQQAAHQETPTTSSSVNANSAGSYSADVTRAAQQKLNAKAQLTDLQKKAISDDPTVKAAREKLDTSLTKYKAEQAKFAEVVQADKDWQAAKQKYDAAAKG